MRPGSGVHDIPHLRLPIESGTVETGGQGVIGMDLFSNKSALELFYKFGEALAVEGPSVDYGLVAGDSGHFPALVNMVL